MILINIPQCLQRHCPTRFVRLDAGIFSNVNIVAKYITIAKVQTWAELHNY